MSSYLVVNADIVDAEMLVKYSKAAGPTVAGRPLKAVVVSNEAEALEGTPAGKRVVIIEGPTREALLEWYNSPEYQAVIGMRLAATNGFAVIVDGL